MGVHRVNGSPVNPELHKHIGVLLKTRHSVFEPQEPGHGSAHFRLIQASLEPHSLLLTHPGISTGKFAQDGNPFLTWHCDCKPHGDGLHGSVGLMVTLAVTIINAINTK